MDLFTYGFVLKRKLNLRSYYKVISCEFILQVNNINMILFIKSIIN
jgi:hypothetical protein